MRPFDSFVMVDWSAANDTGPTPQKDAIWFCAAEDGRACEPLYCRNRSEASDRLHLIVEQARANDKRTLIAFDFPFGYPKGFAQALTGSPDPFAVWRFIHDTLDDASDRNNRFEVAGKINGMFPGTGPFWFNGTQTDIPNLPRNGSDRQGHGMAERREVEQRTRGTFTCWQMGGAGAVGGQVMTGVRVLYRLRMAYPDDVAVWPFELLEKPVALVEAWPGLIAAAVRDAVDPIKDRAQVRLMARALSRLSPVDLQAMLDVDAPEEGWILGVGHEATLQRQLWPN